MIKCLVTGGAGFIGSHLTELLLDSGHTVIAVDNLVVGSENNLKHLKECKNLDFVKQDVTDYDALEKISSNIDWIFHLAGLADIVPSIESPESYFQTNVIGSYNIAKLAREKNVKKKSSC